MPTRITFARRALVAAALGLLPVGCDDAATGARIEAVAPAPLQPGAALEVTGRGFGAAPVAGDLVALGGRPLTVSAWSSDRLRALVPPDAFAGETYLLVRAQGATLAPFPVRIDGDRRRPPTDAGIEGTDAADATSPTDARARVPDTALPDAVLEGARAEFIPDDPTPSGLRLEGRPSPPGELRLDLVTDRPAWGLAFHLTWDPNLLRFVSATPEPRIDGPRTVVWREIEPGRLAFGGLPADATVLSLRFALVGTGEGRLEFPARFATARDENNVPLVGWSWRAGTVRSREDSP